MKWAVCYNTSGVFLLQVLREFKHVNPQDDEEGKEFSNARVCVIWTVMLILFSLQSYFSKCVSVDHGIMCLLLLIHTIET